MVSDKVNKIIEENPSMEYLRKILDDGIIVISPDVEKYKTDPDQISLPGFTGKKTISKQFIIDIISNDDSFNKIKKVYENNVFAVVTLFIGENGEFKDQYNLDRMLIVNILKTINKDEYPSISERYAQIMDYVSYDKYIEKTKNDSYEIMIDGKGYKFPVKLFYNFMNLSDDEFDVVMQQNIIYGNIPIDHFLYSLNKYFEDNKIKNNYLISDGIKNRLEQIKSSRNVDVQMLNEYLNTTDTLINKINVDVELENLILSGMSSSFNDLEKAIYVYIKMCKTLTYDEEFYAVNQVGPLSDKHKTIDNIVNITVKNNKVVCYEFNAIYSYLLCKLGINYKNFVATTNINGNVGEEEFDELFNTYSEGHTYLKYRCGKYLVKADSVTSILHGDIMQAKLNQPLKGLTCENINDKTKEEFYEVMSRVYAYIAEREPKISRNPVEKIESFDDIVSEFNKKTDKLELISINEKIDILISKINKTKLSGIDAYSYLLQLKKILFTEEELHNNIKISIIRNSSEDSAIALAIISIRFKDDNGNMKINRYTYIPGEQLKFISKDDLQAKFSDGTMGYIGKDDPTIPGIKI